MILNRFAAEAGPHISLSAEPLFELGGITVTNSILYGVICAVLIIILSVWAASRISDRPRRGPQQLLEVFVEFITGLLESTLGSRAKAIKYTPIFGTFFLFIVLNNLLGLLPIVGPGVTINGVQAFRPFTADLNGTIALAVVAIIFVQVLSIRESGWLGHLKHYFTDKPWNPINFFIGLLEVFGELTRVMSLSLRLFLNTAVGEILISVFAFVGQSAGSFTILPIALFEILVALIQAYVFTILAATYLGLAVAHGGDEENQVDHVPKLTVAEAA